jgi:hypothetical protein
MFAAYVDTMGIQFQERREFCRIEGIIFIAVVSSPGARATRKPSLGIKAAGGLFHSAQGWIVLTSRGCFTPNLAIAGHQWDKIGSR